MSDKIKKLLTSQKLLIQLKRQSIKIAFDNFEKQNIEFHNLQDMIAKELGINSSEFKQWRFNEKEGYFKRIKEDNKKHKNNKQ